MTDETLIQLKAAPLRWWANIGPKQLDWLTRCVGQDILVRHNNWAGTFKMRRPDDGAWLNINISDFMLLDTDGRKYAII